MCLLVILLTVNKNYKDAIGGYLMDNYEYVLNFILKKNYVSGHGCECLL